MILKCFFMKIIGILFYLLFLLSFCAGAQTVIPLYEGAIPGEKQHENKEHDDNGIYSFVSKPDLTIYLPEVDSKVKTVVVICPGGGYHAVCASYEGHKIAKEMNKKEWLLLCLNTVCPMTIPAKINR